MMMMMMMMMIIRTIMTIAAYLYVYIIYCRGVSQRQHSAEVWHQNLSPTGCDVRQFVAAAARSVS